MFKGRFGAIKISILSGKIDIFIDLIRQLENAEGCYRGPF
jgi:hypothetical protein